MYIYINNPICFLPTPTLPQHHLPLHPSFGTVAPPSMEPMLGLTLSTFDGRSLATVGGQNEGITTTKMIKYEKVVDF